MSVEINLPAKSNPPRVRQPFVKTVVFWPDVSTEHESVLLQMLIDRAIEFDRMRRAEPLLSFACTDLTELLNGIRETLFPEIRAGVEWYFAPSKHLATIFPRRKPNGIVFLHPILNCGDMLRLASDVAI